MVFFSPCKINLGLHVLSKREDGYHDIETCLYPIPWHDILEIVSASSPYFQRTGLAIPGTSKENICWRAYQVLCQDFDLPPIQIHLHKMIPIGSGLGGGSSNGTHTLLAINTLFKLNLSEMQLMHYASALGSDCAFFIDSLAAIATGQGNVLTPIQFSLKGYTIGIINPNIHISTAQAYQLVSPTRRVAFLHEVLVNNDITQWRDITVNDFEAVICKKYDIVGVVKEKLYQLGACYASMTGSGSAVYGIFDTSINIKQHFKGMTCWQGILM